MRGKIKQGGGDGGAGQEVTTKSKASMRDKGKLERMIITRRVWAAERRAVPCQTLTGPMISCIGCPTVARNFAHFPLPRRLIQTKPYTVPPNSRGRN